LSVMMLIQYMSMGVFFPMLAHYLKSYLSLSPLQAGIIMAMPAVAAFAAPLLVTRIADRWISAEGLLGICHVLGALALLLFWLQDRFALVLLSYLLFWLIFAPTLAMTNTIAFHHMADARRDFGPVRMWGTIGWVIAGFLFGLLWLRGGDMHAGTGRLPDAFPVSAGVCTLMGIYTMTLPRVQGGPSSQKPVSGWAGLRVFTRRSLAVLAAMTYLNTVLNMFYVNWMSPYLSQQGIPDGWILPLLGVGQISEFVAMGILGRILGRLELKRTLMLGILMQVVRFAIFAFCDFPGFLIAAIALHGLTYTCFFITAFIYVDNHCRREERAGAQLAYNTIISGFGNLSGSLLAGAAAQALADPSTHLIDYHRFWFIPGIMAVAVLALTGMLFREEKARGEEAAGR
ncbi:MAG: MFS transporter, partial [Candidatus Hydrogenedentes bacterium]|nr:MFS transporter [Candidatus Hydrogenedentota bacterium]